MKTPSGEVIPFSEYFDLHKDALEKGGYGTQPIKREMIDRFIPALIRLSAGDKFSDLNDNQKQAIQLGQALLITIKGGISELGHTESGDETVLPTAERAAHRHNEIRLLRAANEVFPKLYQYGGIRPISRSMISIDPRANEGRAI